MLMHQRKALSHKKDRNEYLRTFQFSIEDQSLLGHLLQFFQVLVEVLVPDNLDQF